MVGVTGSIPVAPTTFVIRNDRPFVVSCGLTRPERVRNLNRKGGPERVID